MEVEWIGKENEVDWIGVEERKGDRGARGDSLETPMYIYVGWVCRTGVSDRRVRPAAGLPGRRATGPPAAGPPAAGRALIHI